MRVPELSPDVQEFMTQSQETRDRLKAATGIEAAKNENRPMAERLANINRMAEETKRILSGEATPKKPGPETTQEQKPEDSLQDSIDRLSKIQ